MKKIALLITAVILSAFLAGCGNAFNDAAKIALKNRNKMAESIPTATPEATPTPNPDFIPIEEAQQKWTEEYEKGKKAIDGIVIELPNYKKVEYKYYFVKQDDYGRNSITIEAEVTNLADLDSDVFTFCGDMFAQTVGSENIGGLSNFMDKPEALSKIRAGGTVTIVQSYKLDDLESDVELRVSNLSQQLRMRLDRGTMPDEVGDEPMLTERAILKIS